MSRTANFECPTIGYFQIPLIEAPQAQLRLNVTTYSTFTRDFKASFIAAIPYYGDKPCQSAIVKQADDMLTVHATSEYSVPYDNIVGFQMSQGLHIVNGSKVAFWANGHKYWAKCELVATDPNVKAPGSVSIDIPLGRNPSILDEIEKLKFEDLKVDKPAVKEETKPVAPPTLKLEFEFKRVKYMGIDCWRVPGGINSALKIKINHEVWNAPNMRLCAVDHPSRIFKNTFSTYKDEPGWIRVSGDINYFWIVNTDEEMVNFDIFEVKIE